MSRFRLVFKGQLLQGADRYECLDQLSRVFREPVETLEKRLFTGGRVIVKRTEHDGTARRFKEAFAKAGAELIIETEGIDFHPSNPRPAVGSDSRMTRKRPSLHPAGDFVPKSDDEEAAHSDDAKETRPREAMSMDDVRPGRRRRRRRKS